EDGLGTARRDGVRRVGGHHLPGGAAHRRGVDQTRLYAGERWVTSRFCEKDIARSPALRVVRVHERR
ncbi:hypothetical protein, partial [Streptomyces griseus]|uniref:hypothetical protein n=1 Tax=Streptomyces griseus TaxID=1911 RepID=UPI0033E1E53A